MSAEPGTAPESNEIVGRQDVAKMIEQAIAQLKHELKAIAPDYLELIDKMLVAKPFVPFRVRTATTEFQIKSPDQGRFNRRGTFEVRNQGDGRVHTLFKISLVEAL